MIDGAGLPLVGFGIVAVVDWIAVACRWKYVEYIAKPLALLLLIDVAITLDAVDPVQRGWFLAALGFSLIGDVLLMLAKPRFVEGLAAFLLAHVCFVVGFFALGASLSARLVSLAVVLVVAIAAVVPLLRALASHERVLLGPVVAYVVAISLMVASAGASGVLLAIGGAALFWCSDYLIAWNRFVRPLAWAPVVIMVTYHLGQLGLVLSLT